MLIGFTGQMFSGKSTAAKIIQSKHPNAYIESFAAPVKKIACECFGWNGIKDEKGRKLLQIIGTEAGRQYNPNIWVDKMRAALDTVYNLESDIVVIDDLRFENEAEFVHELGGKVILMKRDTGHEKSSHASEQGIKSYDYIIDNNNGPIADLEIKITEILSGILK